MGKLQMIKLLLTHPQEFRALASYYMFHEAKRDITNPKEYKTTGYDRDSMKKCWSFLDKTSRSFSAVIKELDSDLARVICLFYLVLRGLDTIEDDMTLSDEIKQPVLRTFHNKLTMDGWTFDGCGPGEKDRQLLVEFDCVITELGNLEPRWRDIIIDITHKMETGMADFAHRAFLARLPPHLQPRDTKHSISPYLASIEEYDLYCHYVAGLVGEGLSRLFSATGSEQPWLADQLTLSNSMGLLLQKTNILRDFKEDVDEARYFWPQEIWGKYGFSTPEELAQAWADPKATYATSQQGDARQRSLWALSHMTLNALAHLTDALDYLVLLRNQSVFNFCAIPATMAIATLEACFMNPNVFRRNVKISRGDAVTLIIRSTNPQAVSDIFVSYARKIALKLQPADPNYIKLSVMLSRVVQWSETHYPSFISVTKETAQLSLNLDDPRAKLIERARDLDREKAMLKGGVEEVKKQRLEGPSHVKQDVPWQLYAFVIVLLGLIILLCLGVAITAMWYFDLKD